MAPVVRLASGQRPCDSLQAFDTLRAARVKPECARLGAMSEWLEAIYATTAAARGRARGAAAARAQRSDRRGLGQLALHLAALLATGAGVAAGARLGLAAAGAAGARHRAGVPVRAAARDACTARPSAAAGSTIWSPGSAAPCWSCRPVLPRLPLRPPPPHPGSAARSGAREPQARLARRLPLAGQRPALLARAHRHHAAPRLRPGRGALHRTARAAAHRARGAPAARRSTRCWRSPRCSPGATCCWCCGWRRRCSASRSCAWCCSPSTPAARWCRRCCATRAPPAPPACCGGSPGTCPTTPSTTPTRPCRSTRCPRRTRCSRRGSRCRRDGYVAVQREIIEGCRSRPAGA